MLDGFQKLSYHIAGFLSVFGVVEDLTHTGNWVGGKTGTISIETGFGKLVVG